MITSPDHPLAEKDTVTIDEIRDYPLINLTDNYDMTTSVEKALKNCDPNLQDFKVCTVDDILNLVSRGRRVSIISPIASYKACEMGLVVARNVEGLKDERNIYFVTTDVVMRSRRYRDFADFIVKNAKMLFESFDGCVWFLVSVFNILEFSKFLAYIKLLFRKL